MKHHGIPRIPGRSMTYWPSTTLDVASSPWGHGSTITRSSAAFTPHELHDPYVQHYAPNQHPIYCWNHLHSLRHPELLLQQLILPRGMTLLHLLGPGNVRSAGLASWRIPRRSLDPKGWSQSMLRTTKINQAPHSKKLCTQSNDHPPPEAQQSTPQTMKEREFDAANHPVVNSPLDKYWTRLEHADKPAAGKVRGWPSNYAQE